MMDATKLIAWWGAILSTIVFLWDIYKFRNTGPQLAFQINTGMVVMPSEDKKTYIQTIVTNRGDRPTTLTTIGLCYFEKRWSWAHWRNRPIKAAVLNDPNPAQRFPHKLASGEVWRGMTEQMPELEKWGREGLLYFDLYHTHQVRPIRQRVRFRPKPNPAT